MAVGWRAEMEQLRAVLRQKFEVDDHPLVFESAECTMAQGCELHHLRFRTSKGEAVRGVLCRPQTASEPLPAMLVIHAHGNRYDIGCDELMAGRPALAAPLGPELARIGIQSLCLDMPCFGTRSGMGESYAAKAALWQGRSLAGQMLGESRSALDWLVAEPGVRAGGVGVFGISMGATLGYWLAAVEPRLALCAQECCLADFATLIQTGAHDLHGIYLAVPGLLRLASNGVIAGLLAPRAQFIGLGDTDPLTPPLAADRALAAVGQAYAARGGRLVVHRETDSGHAETPAMRAALLTFLSHELGEV